MPSTYGAARYGVDSYASTVPSFRAATVLDDSSVTSALHDIAVPAAALAGDFALLFVYTNNPRTVTNVAHIDGTAAWALNSGINPIVSWPTVNFQNVYVYGQFLTASDIAAGTLRVTLSAAESASLALAVYDGATVNAASPISGTAGSASATSSTPTAPTMTPARTNTRLVWASTDWNGGTMINLPTVLPSGSTGAWSTRAQTSGSSGAPLTVGDIALTAAGTATGAMAGSKGNAGFWTAHAILLAPSATTTLTRTGNPVTASLSGNSAQRLASPVTAALSASNSTRVAQPVTAALSGTTGSATPVFRAQTLVDHSGSPSATHDIAIPAAAQAGDFALMFIYTNNPTTVSGIAYVGGTGAWTLASSPNPIVSSINPSFQNVFVYGRYLTGADITAGTLRITLSGSDTVAYSLDVYSSVDPVTPVDGSATSNTGTSVSPTAPTITPSLASCRLVWAATDWNIAGTIVINQPATLPTGSSGAWATRTQTASGNGAPLTVADVALTTSGTATGALIGSTSPSSSDFWTACAILLRPGTSSTTNTRTATPVTAALSGGLSTRTATPVTVSLSGTTGTPVTLSVAGATQLQVIDGFGVNANTRTGSDQAVNLATALDWLTNDLRATIWRVDPYGTSDWLPNQSDVANQTSYASIYENAIFQSFWATLSYLYAHNCQVVVSFSGIVPTWMGGPGFINSAQEDNFAEMVCSVVDWGRRVKGLPITMLDPLNETDNAGGGPVFEGPSVNPTQMVRIYGRIITNLHNKGYDDVQLLVPNISDVANENQYLTAIMADASVMAKVQHWCFHNYASSSGDINTLISASAYPTRNYWMSEWSQMTTDGNLETHDVADEWLFARTDTDYLISHLQQNAAAMLHWDAWDNLHRHVGTWTYFGLLDLPINGVPAVFTRKKRYYSNSQVFTFVRPGWRRVGCNSNSGGVNAVAFTDGAGNLTVVGHNTGGTALITVQVAGVPGLPSTMRHYETSASQDRAYLGDVTLSGGSLTAQVPPDTIFTFSTLFATQTPTRTASPVTAALAPTSSTRTATPVTSALQATRQRVALPVTAALAGGAGSQARTVSPVTTTLSGAPRRVATNVTASIQGPSLLLTVEIAFASNPNASTPIWTDVTPYVQSLATRRGRSNELDRFEAGTCDVVFKNQDRRFDPIHAASPYYPNVTTGKRMRVRANWFNVDYYLFDGYIDAWPQTWDGKVAARVKMHATDAFKNFNLTRLSGDVPSRIMGDSPIAYWKFAGDLNDASGQNNVGAWTGPNPTTYGNGPLAIAVSDQAKYFGSGDFMTNQLIGWSSAGFTFSAWLYPTWVGNDGAIHQIWAANSGGTNSVPNQVVISKGTDNLLRLHVVSSSGVGQDITFPVNATNWPANAWRHVAAVAGLTGMTLYLDGQQVATISATISLPSVIPQAPILGNLWIGYMSHVAFFPTALRSDQIAAQYQSSRAYFPSETSASRVARVLDVVAWPTARRNILSGVATLAAGAATDSAASYLQTVNSSEVGRLFMDGQGRVVFLGRDALASVTTVLGVFGDGGGTELPYSDLTLSFDDSRQWNEIILQRVGGIPQVARDPALQQSDIVRTYSDTNLLHSSDPQVLSAAQYRLSQYKLPHLRVDGLAVQPYRDGRRMWPQVLGREIGDRVTVVRRPQGVGSPISQESLIEAIEHEFHLQGNWTTRFSLSMADVTQYWVLGTAGRSELGTTTILSF
jgi:O-glycosyl hydrolase